MKKYLIVGIILLSSLSSFSQSKAALITSHNDIVLHLKMTKEGLWETNHFFLPEKGDEASYTFGFMSEKDFHEYSAKSGAVTENIKKAIRNLTVGQKVYVDNIQIKRGEKIFYASPLIIEIID